MCTMLPRQYESLPPNIQNDVVRPYFDSLNRQRGALWRKAALDRVVAALLLIILSPFLLIAAALVAFTSKGPVFYRQIRVGFLGKPFAIVKFRTMVPGADRAGAITVGRRDPRITRTGHMLRATKLDELPQMVNVLLGQMSLVGPRPEVSHYVEFYEPEMMATLLVRPGVTGTASLAFRDENRMLSGREDPEAYYKTVILPCKMAINLEYMRRITLWNDIKILARTAFCAVK